MKRFQPNSGSTQKSKANSSKITRGQDPASKGSICYNLLLMSFRN